MQMRPMRELLINRMFAIIVPSTQAGTGTVKREKKFRTFYATRFSLKRTRDKLRLK